MSLVAITPKGFDQFRFCPYGFFAQNSIKLPRTADLQYVGTVTKNPQIGDLVFFQPTKSTSIVNLCLGQYLLKMFHLKKALELIP